jgi:DNA topoisomerase IB
MVTAGAVDAIATAGLEQVSPFEPGIRRVRGPDGFEYSDADGQLVDDPHTLEPGWTAPRNPIVLMCCN